MYGPACGRFAGMAVLRTLYRAKAELKIRAVKDGPMKDGQRAWRWYPSAKELIEV
jgi:hypothetical protein